MNVGGQTGASVDAAVVPDRDVTPDFDLHVHRLAFVIARLFNLCDHLYDSFATNSSRITFYLKHYSNIVIQYAFIRHHCR